MDKKWFLALIVLLVAGFLVYQFSTTGKAVQEAEYTGNNVSLVVFYKFGCPICAEFDAFIEGFSKSHPGLKVEKLDIYKSIKLVENFSRIYNVEIDGVPAIFIGDKAFIGFSSNIEKQIIEEISKCEKEACISPLERIKTNVVIGSQVPIKPAKKLTIPAVIIAAAADSINPCEFAILLLLLTTILASGNRKKALFAGLAFAFAIFVSYFLMGLGLYSALKITGLTRIFYFVVAVLAIIVGLFNLKDYIWYGKWFKMEVPMSWRPKMQSFVKSVTSVPGAFIVGIIVSMFLLPCTSGPYIVILGLLANIATKNYALMLLALYNLIFIIPMIAIIIAVYLGLSTTEKAEEWRKRKLKALHLIAGIIMLLLGIAMLVSSLAGWI